MSVVSWPDPLVQPTGLTRLTEHVHVIPDGGVPGVPNVGIVVGTRRVLVIDTGIGDRNGRAVLAAARSLAPSTPLTLMSTHVHPEHDLGAGAFPVDTTMIRARTQVAEIAEDGLRVADDFRRRSPAYARLLDGATFRDADIVFDDALELDLGGVGVRIRSMGSNHTPGDTIAYVVGDDVLFPGDIAMHAPPALASPRSSLRRWLQSLDELEAMAAQVLVPSHGPIGDAGFIRGYRAYFHEVRRRTAAARAAGATTDQVVSDVTAALVDRYPDAGRIAGAVRAADAELQEDTHDA